MKRAIFISLLSIVSLLSLGQSRLFDRNETEAAHSLYNKVITFRDGSWITGGVIGDCYYSLLVRRDSVGEIIWKKTFLSGVITYLQQESNGQIYASGNYIGDDDVFADNGVFALVYNNSGTLLNYHVFVADSMQFVGGDTTHTSYLNSWAKMIPNHIALLDSNYILLASDSNLVKIKKADWSVQWVKNFNAHINDVSINGSSVYLSTDNGVITTDTSGSIQYSVLTSASVYDSYINNHTNYFLCSDKIIMVDSSLNIIHDFSKPLAFDALANITVEGSNVYCCAISGTNCYMLILDTALNYQRQFPLANQCIMPTDIAINNGIIDVISNYNDTIPFSVNSYPTTFWENNGVTKTYDINGGHFSSSCQLSFISVREESSQATFDYSINTGNQIINLFNITSTSSFLVKNIGADTIYHFNIESDIFGGMNCALGYYFLNKDTVLAPNDTMRFYDQAFRVYDVENGLTINRTYIITSVNNSRPNDNCMLPSIKLSPFTVTAISELTSSTFHIYPNPTTNILNIQTEEATNATIFISDLTGRILMQQLITSGTNQINIGSFAQGMYIYTIKDGRHNPVTGKIEKI